MGEEKVMQPQNHEPSHGGSTSAGEQTGEESSQGPPAPPALATVQASAGADGEAETMGNPKIHISV